MTTASVGSRGASVAVMIVAGALLAGCATKPTRAYMGPELPGSQIARIYVDQEAPPPAYSGRTSEKATIRSLDGKATEHPWWASAPKEILVLPGQHTVLARVAGQGSALGAVGDAMIEKTVRKWDAPLTFASAAGKAYRIRFEYVKGPQSPEKEDYFDRNKGKLWVYWIEEAETGNHVCGWRANEWVSGSR